MVAKIYKAHKSEYGLYLEIGIISALVFVIIYGVRILNPTYTTWLYNGADLTQHYLGWKAYRLSAWHFPLGIIDNLSYPNEMSVIFTDSIPLFALVFKLFAFALPSEFQYFGIWGLMSYILQGILAARILKKYNQNRLVLILSSSMFLFVPVMMERMYYHTALAGQWIILLSLEVFLNWKSDDDDWKYVRRICVIAILSASVHIYFVLINGIILFGIVLKNIINRSSLIRQILLLITYVLVAGVVVYILGGFVGNTSNAKEGLGVYAFNLNGFFNPAGIVDGGANIFPNLPFLTEWPDEGYSYLGAGFIFLLVFVVGIGIFGLRTSGGLFGNKGLTISLLTISLLSIIFALSPRAGLGQVELYNLGLPEIILKAWSVFRATGRIAWICMYIVMFCSLIYYMQVLNQKKLLAGALLFILLVIQVYDLGQIITYKHNIYSSVQTHESLLQDEKWDEIAAKSKIKHIIYMSDMNIFEMFEFGNYALNNDMTTSDFYYARSNKEIIELYRNKEIEHPTSDEIFIFKIEDESEALKYDMNCYYADEYIIMARGL